ncbi:MAG: lamin tail domain-containing protein, partial [Candidatus Cloacimonetes bacterium]|nr:lamin tail domain-containing protein [Candidatus Cloacimonadota bacterium]
INSTGNQITPEIVTLDQISTNFEEYEAELIKVLAVDFTDTGTFQTGQVYEVTDASRATGNFRTTFYDADYIGTAIPSISVNLTVICNSRSDGEFITSRSLADIEPASGDETITVLIPNGGEMWYQGTSQTISWASYNFTGDVIIELLQNSSNPVILISSTENDGYWTWDIPTDLPVADNYSISVSDVDDGDPADESDAYFSILEQVPQPDQGDVIITEIIQNPAAVADDAGEWFELYNTTGIAIDIDGWIIRDADNDEHIITNASPLIIMPYDYLVLGINADEQTNGGVLVDYQYSTFTLANGEDEVILFWVDGTTEIDRVEYDDGVTFPDPNGASIALNPYFMNYEDNDLGTNWYTSYTVYGDGDMGTPGEENPEPPIYPEAPSSPQPADGSTDIEIDPILTWVNGDFTQTIDLYFGTEDPPVTMVLDNVTAVETYTPETLLENTTYYWQVICRNSFGDTEGDIWNFTTESTAWEENQIPGSTSLIGNYPNPFNPSTVINFTLAENTKVALDILDIRGILITTIVNDYLTANSYSLTWTGVNDKGEKVPSGVYLYRLKTADSSQVRKMLLLK